MKRREVISAIILLCLSGGAGYIWSRSPTRIPKDIRERRPPSGNALWNGAAAEILRDPRAQKQEPPPPPPPPPPPLGVGGQAVSGRQVEPHRSLVGVTESDMRAVERYLPNGAQIYTYAFGSDNLAAALISTDLDGDRREETVVVYNERAPTSEEGSLPLIISVLIRSGSGLRVRASLPLLGGVFFNPRIEGLGGPFAVRDLLGNSRPQIIVVSGGGASVGGALQIFSFNGSTLDEIGHIGGHFFAVRNRGLGKPSVIEARWKDDENVRSYEWNGERFGEVSRLPGK